MTRTYEAYADNGRDYFTFTYESEHRNNSKANREDAMKHWHRHHGYKSKIEIISTSYMGYDYMGC